MQVMKWLQRWRRKTTVEDLKDPNKPGSWDAVTQAAVKRAVSSDIRLVGQKPIAVLMEHGGMTERQVDVLVDHSIEGEVHS